MSAPGQKIPPLDYEGPVGAAYPGFSAEWLERPVFARFAEQAARYPGQVAIRDRTGQTTYAELLDESLRLGAQIDRSVPTGAPVALALPTDRHYPAAMLAALAAGRPYVPLNLAYPRESLRHVLAHCGAQHVVTTAAALQDLQDVLPQGTVPLLSDGTPPAAAPTPWQARAAADDIAYVLYTSGSSGSPKGVYQDQRSLTHDVMQYTCSAHLGPGDVLTCLYSPSVNGALRDIYGALLNGATLLLFDLNHEGLGHLAQALTRWGATILHAMPPVMRSFLRTLESGVRLPSVRLVYLAGDKLVGDDLDRLRERLEPDAQIYFGIGSTECATLYRQWFIPPEFSAQPGIVPAGRAVPDRHVELLDPHGHPVAPGEIGEIVVSSRYLARGYWRDAELTRARFTPSPQWPGATRFLTGDLGSIAADGLLTFHGRSDQQIKIRGYRVEPAGVEAALRTLSGVEEAAIVVQRQGEPRLVGFVVHTDATDLDRIRRGLREILPLHSCPAALFALASLPQLSNFKVDSAALAQLAEGMSAAPSAPIAADSELERIVTRCWLGVLGTDRSAPQLSFLEAGGDSLKALELHIALENALRRTLPLDGFELDMTARELADWLRTLSPAIPPHEDRKAIQLFICPPADGIQPITLALRDQLADAMAVVPLDYPPASKARLYSASITELAAHCRAEIERRRLPGRRLVVLGQSSGSRIAHLVSTSLEASGTSVDLLVMTDIAPSTILAPPPQGAAAMLRRLLGRAVLPFVPIAALERWDAALASRGFAGRLATQAVSARRRDRQIGEWQAARFGGQALLLVSAETLQRFPRLSPDLGWAALCPRLTVQPLGLGHADYAAHPASTALVGLIGALAAPGTLTLASCQTHG